MSTLPSTSLTSSSGIYAVPKLINTNWVEFKIKTIMSLQAQGLACHLEGTVKVPEPLPCDPNDSGKILKFDKSKLATEEEIKENYVAHDAYAQKEALAIQQLFATVLNTVLIWVPGKRNSSQDLESHLQYLQGHK
ncbi:hypothetical protein EDD16DRAFT_1498642 [Pisolithus croceorrhizus]|nr:hypothetical protein EDD16DRAFT_1498642 [Pisolithus croceorrhizus]KAI6112335.1 hypothetical protein EV401DRAFT_1867427 [Pisolithus croceorrhizus]KAI6151399.1 hypothetical protein EDD17DRAFT_1491383 [Pisolithus thermaeus]